MVYQLQKRANGPLLEETKETKNGGKNRKQKGGKKKGGEHRKQKGKEKRMKKNGEHRFGPWVNFKALENIQFCSISWNKLFLPNSL
jgi:hypothetical protein